MTVRGSRDWPFLVGLTMVGITFAAVGGVILGIPMFFIIMLIWLGVALMCGAFEGHP